VAFARKDISAPLDLFQATTIDVGPCTSSALVAQIAQFV
jgi:hypothetical protein